MQCWYERSSRAESGKVFKCRIRGPDAGGAGTRVSKKQIPGHAPVYTVVVCVAY